MHDSLISVSHQTCRAQNVKVIHECQVSKGMRCGMLIVARGGVGGGGSGDLLRENFIILEVHGCDFNAILDHNWFYNHKE